MKILLTGSAGQLGREILPLLMRMGEVTRVDRDRGAPDAHFLQRDLRDLEGLDSLLHGLQPELIINAAAYTAVDRAETDAEAAFRVNADLPGYLARWSKQRGSLLVHYSTDYVFSGEISRPYRETDSTGPLSVYAESKLNGERAIAASGCRHAVLRTSWLYSGHGNNFVLTMLRLARERSSLRVVDDQVGCPTWARNVARSTIEVITHIRSNPPGSRDHGTWHLCDSGIVSWYDFARAIFEIALEVGLLEKAPEVRAIPTSEYPLAAERPRFSALDTSAIGQAFGIAPAGLQDSLRACLEELKGHDEV
jgi:dTDP-4-dehydrorhamnose reductase